MLSVAHIFTSTTGGAGRASYRIHQSLASDSSHVHSAYLALSGLGAQQDVQRIPLGLYGKALVPFLCKLEAHKLSRLKSTNYNYRTTGFPGYGIGRFLNKYSADIIHMHAVGDGLLSIEDLPKIAKPLVWTLHDEWAFCGAEHYSEPVHSPGCSASLKRYEVGYTTRSRSTLDTGPDIDQRTWRRKLRAWRQPFQLVAPSHWLAQSVRKSQLLHDWPVAVIPNPINTTYWQAVDQQQARHALGLPADETLILFGVDHGCAHPRKGADLLLEAFTYLQRLSDILPRIPKLVVFGQQLFVPPSYPQYPFHYIGKITEDSILKMAYSACNAVIIPSRQDNLPNVGLEAQACSTPVVAFATGGLPDVVDDRVTGALASPHDPRSLAEAILWVTSDLNRNRRLGEQARLRSEALWSSSVVAHQYETLYRSITHP